MRGHPASAIFLSVLAASLLGGCSNSSPTGKTGFSADAAPNADKELPNYAKVARILANDLLTDPNQKAPNEDLAQILAEMQEASMTLSALDTKDQELRSVANDANTAILEARSQLLKLQSMPRPPGAGEFFVENFIRGLFLDIPGAMSRIDEVSAQERAILNELRSLAGTMTKLKAAQLVLPRIAAKYQNPSRAVSSPLKIDFDESWQSFGPDDWLSVANTTGTDLSKCTLLVELHGKKGEVVRNVHYVENWPAGHWLYAKYGGGMNWGGDIVGRDTVTLVQKLHVSVWSNEVKKERIEYIYAGEEKTKDVKRYCEKLWIGASYRPFSGGIVWNDYRGARVQMKGISVLRNSRITITFRNGSTEKAFYWDVQQWHNGETKTFETEKLTWDPTSFSIDLSFPETDYVHRVGPWIVKK
jgi:hypothetical protein